VGIWHESMNNGMFDNVVVTGAGDFGAVVSFQKLATTWAEIKDR